MSNNRAFTSDFVSGLLSQRNTDAIEASRVKRMRSAILRRVGIANAMSHIKMHIGEWYDDVDGCRTRQVWQIERQRNRPAAIQDSKIGVDGGMSAEENLNSPVSA